MPTLSLFSDYFAHERNGAEKDGKVGASDASPTDGDDGPERGGDASSSSAASGSPGDGDGEAEDGAGGVSQQLQQLVISPRTAFDDISVSSSVASSCSAASSSNSRSRGPAYRQAPPRRAAATGKSSGSSSGTGGDVPVSTRQKR